MKPTVLAGPFAALLLALVLVALPAASSQSQGPAQSKWWQSEPYKRELNLTPAKSQELEKIFQAAVPTLRNLKKAFDEAEALFEQLAAQGNKTAAGEQITRMTAARAALWESHHRMLLDMRFALTPEQWAKFNKMQQQQQLANEKQGVPEKGK